MAKKLNLVLVLFLMAFFSFGFKSVSQDEQNLTEFKNLKPFDWIVIDKVESRKDDEGSLTTGLDLNNIYIDRDNNAATYIRVIMHEIAKNSGGGVVYALHTEKAYFNTGKFESISSCELVTMGTPIARVENAVLINGDNIGMIYYERNADNQHNIEDLKDDHWKKLIGVVRQYFEENK